MESKKESVKIDESDKIKSSNIIIDIAPYWLNSYLSWEAICHAIDYTKGNNYYKC